MDEGKVRDLVAAVVDGVLGKAEGSAAGRAEIAIGADHGGYELKESLERFLESRGLSVLDCGTHSKDSVDYPDFAHAVARAVSEGRAGVGIVVDGAGIGSCMAANKVPGVRASMCFDVATARNAREHNHANLLTLGAGYLSEAAAKDIVDAWLSTPWGPDRHARRVAKIDAIEQTYSGVSR